MAAAAGKLFLQFCDQNLLLPPAAPHPPSPPSPSSSLSSFWATSCPQCHQSAQSHPLAFVVLSSQRKKHQKSKIFPEEVIRQVFCEIRNYRVQLVAYAAESGRSSRISSIEDSFQSIFHLKSLRDQPTLASFYLKFNEFKTLNLSKPINQFNALIALDECYHQLYYYSQLHNMNSAALTIPPPHEYFSFFLYDEAILNAALNEFITTNFSDEYKHHISERWGLFPTASGSPSSPFDSNPLLRLQFSRWRETIYLFTKIFPIIGDKSTIPVSFNELKTLCLAAPNPENGNHATMRLSGDPLLPHLHRLWFDSVRVWACHLYAYATPTPNAIDSLVKCMPLVEVGAGTGYWTMMIENRLREIQETDVGNKLRLPAFPFPLLIQGFDKDPTGTRSNSYHGQSRAWTSTISQGNAVDSITTANRRLNTKGAHTQLSLFLCYPPPDSDMALQSLRQYISMDGHTVCYVGEYRGDTGTKSFEKLLESAYSCLQEISLPNWGDTAYNLTIWKKKGSGSLLRHPSRKCRVCDQYVERPYRCRITYAVTFCCENCAASSRGKDIHCQELSYRCLYRKEQGHEPVKGLDPQPQESASMKKRKKREISPTQEEAAPRRRAARESDDSDSEVEDIRTQLKKFRREQQHQTQQSQLHDPPQDIRRHHPVVTQLDRIELIPQWFMTL